MRVLIVGSGTMGVGIAQLFAVNGHDVVLVDQKKTQIEAAERKIRDNLSSEVAKNRMDEPTKRKISKRLRYHANPSYGQGCDLVIEAIVESLAEKMSLFSSLEQQMQNQPILATNTSSLSITSIASAVSCKDRVIGMHFFNPVNKMRLVEVIQGEHTSDIIVQKTMAVAKSLGKEAVKVKEAPGFVVNRILIPMINEAIGVLADGTAAAQDIDRSMVYGANHPIGPLALSDLIGNDVVLAIMNALYDATENEKYKPQPLLEKMVQQGRLGKKTRKGFYDY